MGNNISEKYKFIKMLGRGGMAEVWKAEDRETGKVYAIKKILIGSKPQMEQDRDAIRFKNEFKTSKGVNSPYVMKVYDAVLDDNQQVIVCEYISGQELKRYIRQFSALNVDEVVSIAKQLALGFKAIHDAGVVHRDIKSSNIMVLPNLSVKIIDFGIAISNETEAVTKTNSVIGSVYYMAPELLDKEDPTPQSDIYSLGVLMYEMLVGEPPFRAHEPQETAMMHKNKTVPWVNKVKIGVPQSIANIIRKCTAKRPELRYATMKHLYDDLSTALNTERISEPPIDLENTKKKSFMDIMNSKGMLITMGVAVVAIITIIIIVIILALV